MGGISMSIRPVTESATVWINDLEVEVSAGISIAAALLAAGHNEFRRTPRHAEPRGIFCGMGSCYDCVVAVDGVTTRTCITPVTTGMRIETSGSDGQ